MEETHEKVGLEFPPEKTDKPIVTNLVKFNLTFNILKAYVSPGKTGYIILELAGTDANIKKGLDYLENEGIIVKIYTDSVIRYEEKCMHCGACTSVCPSGALTMNRDTWELEFNMDKCLLCGHCVRACPARAIKSFDDTIF
ncbi:MAG: 4Fe-4S binding protein [Eubacteriales bacterium]|nr:4Fe-4S binding protein [Eubacteriales bacterium]